MSGKIDRQCLYAESLGELCRKRPPGVDIRTRFVEQQHTIRTGTPADATDDRSPGERQLYGAWLKRRVYVPHSLCL